MPALIVSGIEFLMMTSFPQLLGAGVTMKSDIQNEIDRQTGICNQTTDTKAATDVMNGLVKTLSSAIAIDDATDKIIADLQDNMNASLNRVKYLQKQFNQKLLILIVINIIVVALVAIFLTASV